MLEQGSVGVHVHVRELHVRELHVHVGTEWSCSLVHVQ